MWSPDGGRSTTSARTAAGRGCANIVCQDVSSRPTLSPYRAHLPRGRHASAGPASAATASGSSTSAAPTCGSSARSGARRASWPSRSTPTTRPTPSSTVTFTQDATEFALSPDENAVVFAVHGELFLIRLPGGGKATRLTDSPAFDHGVAFSPDGKSILFVSDRTGHEDLYLLEPDDPEHPELTKAHKFKVKQLTDTPEAEIGVAFARRASASPSSAPASSGR